MYRVPASVVFGGGPLGASSDNCFRSAISWHSSTLVHFGRSEVGFMLLGGALPLTSANAGDESDAEMDSKEERMNSLLTEFFRLLLLFTLILERIRAVEDSRSSFSRVADKDTGARQDEGHITGDTQAFTEQTESSNNANRAVMVAVAVVCCCW